jgi:hypothetical protein
VALGQVFSEYFGFPCQAFHRLLHSHHHHPLSGAGTLGQNSGRCAKWTQCHCPPPPQGKNTLVERKIGCISVFYKKSYIVIKYGGYTV